MLPSDFVPSNHSVLIGRARECKEAIGNRRLRVLVESFLQQYEMAINRNIKSQIVSKIVAMVRGACPLGAFVKKIGNAPDFVWVEVDDSVAREKVGYTFRDLLSDKYRSSSKSKAIKRQKEQERKQKALNASGTVSFKDYMRMACTIKEGAPPTVPLGQIPTSLFELKENDFTGGKDLSTNKTRVDNDVVVKAETKALHVPPLRRKSEIEWMELMKFKLGA